MAHNGVLTFTIAKCEIARHKSRLVFSPWSVVAVTLSEILALSGFLAANFLAAGSGAFFRPGKWYEGLRKPWWNPPNWLFPPAWTVLFILIAVAGWLVWREVGFSAVSALPFAIYVLQLLLNATWSALFFGMKRMDIAFVDVAALWLAIAATIALFAPISALAAELLVPYILWVSFAGVLNFTLWRLNPVPREARR